MTTVDGLTLMRAVVRETRGEDPGPEPPQCRDYLESLERGDPAGHEALIITLLDRLAVWFPVDLYRRLPVVVPHVVRDNDCRKHKCELGHRKLTKGRVGEARDVWSTPSPEGYVRDDNSLIKNLVKSLPIDSTRPLAGARLGKDFVACHVWRMKDMPDPWLNSFVPNLVWLPRPLDVLSDRPGHIVQTLLRRRAHATFRGASTCAPAITDGLWRCLAAPPAGGLHNAPAVNTFRISARWSASRLRKVHALSALLDAHASGKPYDGSSGHSHYDQHLHQLDRGPVRPLARRLAAYVLATS